MESSEQYTQSSENILENDETFKKLIALFESNKISFTLLEVILIK